MMVFHTHTESGEIYRYYYYNRRKRSNNSLCVCVCTLSGIAMARHNAGAYFNYFIHELPILILFVLFIWYIWVDFIVVLLFVRTLHVDWKARKFKFFFVQLVSRTSTIIRRYICMELSIWLAWHFGVFIQRSSFLFRFIFYSNRLPHFFLLVCHCKWTCTYVLYRMPWIIIINIALSHKVDKQMKITQKYRETSV